MTYAIECTNLVKQFGGFCAVNNINLRFERGQISALLGPNGAGKTTTISMILGLQKPTSGEIKVLGQPAGTKELRQRVGALMQDVKAADGLNVAEVLNLFRSYYRNPLPLSRLLDLSGLHAEAKRRASSLSGGQRRRLAFAQSLAGNPELVLLDEPTVGMDVEARGRFWDTVRALSNDGRTVVLTTHDLEEADAVSDHIAIIAGGAVAASGTSQELKAQTTLRTLSFSLQVEQQDEALMQLPGVVKVERASGKIRIHVRNTDEVLSALMQSGWGVRDIDIQSAKLEDAFRTITKSHEAAR
ncbi:ATP-binding cassette domain-containing protein [Paenibacillus alvei]|uniref:ABC transporter ATP-binding protein n=1 Tax=Paenibacillus alvei TaxID=44250 RepID=UPI0018CD7AB9|nr:ABC transporter ATP-binding protein [Paenibacillus alvei]MBG9732760.1 ABC transporter ATP-binding protein [Paenibacillus alvei]MBG9744171.1 ABC transporter ATP-binding protein [Paenibacillus alvei]MCY9580232.1 ABC transporter ATP-binding protein [Paenibacillus alvei]MCY9588139.1 ABC transporter ATP-binding protein [Paenibacillus alvei]